MTIRWIFYDGLFYKVYRPRDNAPHRTATPLNNQRFFHVYILNYFWETLRRLSKIEELYNRLERKQDKKFTIEINNKICV